MTHEPKKRFDQNKKASGTSLFPKTPMQKPMKYGCPVNAVGSLGDSVKIDTTPMVSSALHSFRDCESTKYIHDSSFRTAMPGNILFDAMKKKKTKTLPKKYRRITISPFMMNDEYHPSSNDMRILEKYTQKK